MSKEGYSMLQVNVNDVLVELPKANTEQLEQILINVIKRIESEESTEANC